MPENHETVTMYVSLDADQHRAMSYWHTRTTMLWNVVVAHLGTYAELYLRETDGPASDNELAQVIDGVYATIVNEDTNLVSDFVLGEQWKESVSKIKELPKEVVEYRLIDLKGCYMAAKQRVLKDNRANSCIPAIKTVRSNQSVRFSNENFTLSGDTLTIHGPNGLTIKHPTLRDIKVEPTTLLSVSRRKVKPTIREQWALQENLRPYSLSFVSR